MLRLGIDIGGTFTDFALVDAARGRSFVHKRLTTPDDPARAVIEGAHAILDGAGVAMADLAEIVHGTTLVTNALIERRLARTGMLVTEGFRDVFDIGRESRYDLYDLRLRFAEPIVPRLDRAEVRERMRHDGSVETPLDPDSVRGAVRALLDRGIEALAICFLHSYADPAHEEEAARIAAEIAPELFISTSAEVFPQAREFERWTTTCANAAARPMVDAYLARLETGFAAEGFAGRLAIVSAAGGLTSLAAARRFPVRLLESGPAAGVLMAAEIARGRGLPDVLSFDLGGTTAKGALVRGGRPLKTYAFEAAHAHHYRAGSGLPLQIPVIDMTEIGVGGGSLLTRDELGRLRVGPRSAGADPGPACYARGGAAPTLTDANLALGYLDPGFFAGGTLPLDPAAAERALAGLAAELGIDPRRAAWGAHDLANDAIVRAFRMHATERGFDCRRAALTAFGGGGPLHAARIARKLRIPEVIFPADAGVMSAFGMLSGAPSFEVSRSGRRRLAGLGAEELAAMLDGVAAEASAPLLAAGTPPERIRVARRLDMRYAGQGHDLEVALPDGPAEALAPRLPALFEAAYRAVFDTALDQPLEISAWKAEAAGPAAPPAPRSAAGAARGASLKGTRPAWFPLAGGRIDCPVHDRYRLGPGDVLSGPCLVEERESTLLLDAGDVATVAEDGAVVASIGGGA